jgi:hypothetical protein
MQNASDFVKKISIEKGTDTYLSKGLYSTTFSKLNEMNAFSFFQYILPIITPIYRFKFEKEKMVQPYKEKFLIDTVTNILFKGGKYKIKTANEIYQTNNIVLATQISWSKKYAGVNKANFPVSTNMLHVKGSPKKIISRKSYQLFSPKSNTQAIANLYDGTFLYYYKDKQPNLKSYFLNPKILGKKTWDPVGTINGNTLIECERGNNMYLIGDYNIAGLEESYITGIFAAKKIINSKSI